MKIIQIALSAASACQGEHDHWETLFALTDDGKLFRLDNPSWTDTPKWEVISGPPDDAVPFG